MRNTKIYLITGIENMIQESDISRPQTREREWVRYDFHYDNVPKVGIR